MKFLLRVLTPSPNIGTYYELYYISSFDPLIQFEDNQRPAIEVIQDKRYKKYQQLYLQTGIHYPFDEWRFLLVDRKFSLEYDDLSANHDIHEKSFATELDIMFVHHLEDYPTLMPANPLRKLGAKQKGRFYT